MADLIKATISLKAQSLACLVEAMERIAEDANIMIVMHATVTTSMALDAE